MFIVHDYAGVKSFINDCRYRIGCEWWKTGLRNTNDLFATALHSQKRHRLTASYGFYRLAASSSNSVEFIRLQQVCENQACCKSIFADLLRAAETTCIKLVDKKSWQSTRIKPVDNLQGADLLKLARFWLRNCNDGIMHIETYYVDHKGKHKIQPIICFSMHYNQKCSTCSEEWLWSASLNYVWPINNKNASFFNKTIVQLRTSFQGGATWPLQYATLRKIYFLIIPTLWKKKVFILDQYLIHSWINLVKDLPNLVALYTKLHIVQHV